MPAVQETIDRVRSIDLDQYKYGFETTIEMEKSEKGISEDVVRFISAKKNCLLYTSPSPRDRG